MTPEERRARARRQAAYRDEMRAKAKITDARAAKDEREQKFWAKERVKEALQLTLKELQLDTPTTIGPPPNFWSLDHDQRAWVAQGKNPKPMELVLQKQRATAGKLT